MADNITADAKQSRDTECDFSIVITCHNEENFIANTIDTVVAALQEAPFSHEIIVIDDASTDRSVEKINECLQRHKDDPIRCVFNKLNRGFAGIFVDGSFQAKGKYYRICCGDDAESKEILRHLFQYIGQADLIIPYQDQDKVAGKTWLRKKLSKLVVTLVNGISGFNIKYYNGLPIFLRYQVMRYPPITYGFGFQIDVVTRLLDEGVNFVQVPSSSIDRKGTKSEAMSMRNILSVLHTFLEVGFRRLRRILYGKTIPKAIEVKYSDLKPLRGPKIAT